MKLNLITADENKIKELATRSAFTWEGMDLSDQNLAEIAQVFTDVKAAFCSGRPFLEFKAFHMVKEKDENAFFARHREYVSAALAFMGAVLTALYEADTANTRYDDSISLLAEHQNYCNTLAYLNIFQRRTVRKCAPTQCNYTVRNYHRFQ